MALFSFFLRLRYLTKSQCLVQCLVEFRISSELFFKGKTRFLQSDEKVYGQIRGACVHWAGEGITEVGVECISGGTVPVALLFAQGYYFQWTTERT